MSVKILARLAQGLSGPHMVSSSGKQRQKQTRQKAQSRHASLLMAGSKQSDLASHTLGDCGHSEIA